MRCSHTLLKRYPSAAAVLLLLSTTINTATALDYLYTDVYATCLPDNDTTYFTPTTFFAYIYPSNRTLSYTLAGNNTFSGNDTIILDVTQYETPIYKTEIDPCSEDLADLCPINAGPLNITANLELPSNTSTILPESVLNVNETHAQVQLQLIDTATKQPFACFLAYLTNGVDPDYVPPNRTGDGNVTATPTPTGSHNSSSANSTDAPKTGAGAVSLDWKTSLFAITLVASCMAFM